MAEAKIAINIFTGLLEIEGSEKFVEDKLAKIDALIAKFTTRNTVEGIGNASAPSRNKSLASVKPVAARKSSTKRSGPSCAERILALKDAGFFKIAKSQKQIGEELSARATPYQANLIGASLITIVKGGKLRRIKDSGVYIYVNP